MVKKIIKYAQVSLLVLLILLTGYLSYKDWRGGNVCLPNSQSQCNSVQNSVYGTMFGIKLAYLGFIAFLLLFLIYLGAKVEHARKNNFRKIFLASSFLGAIFAAYFLYIQFFVLKQICQSCIIIDSIIVITFILSVFDFSLELKKPKEVINTAAGN